MISASDRDITQADIEQIERTARIIESAVGSMNDRADDNLGKIFPKTHPDISFNWGLRSHHDSSSEMIRPYSRYLSACIVQYLRNDGVSGLIEPNGSVGDQVIDDSYKIDIDPISGNKQGGQFLLDSKNVWASFIPKKWEQEIEKKLRSELEDSWLKSHLVGFPSYFNSVSPAEDYGVKNFLATLAHEYTHYYVSNNTRIRSELMQAIDTDLEGQMKAVGNNSDIIAIDEIFGHYIGFSIKNRGEVNDSYDRSRYITWGINFLSSYLQGFDNRRDRARQMEVEIFNKIANKGQLKEDSGKRDVLVFFLEECLAEENKNIISGFRKIERKELKQALSDLETLQTQIENPEIKRDVGEALSDLQDIVAIEDNILQYLLDRCFENNGYNDYANRELKNIIRTEYDDLSALVDDLNLLADSTNNSRLENAIENVLQELKVIENHLSKVA